MRTIYLPLCIATLILCSCGKDAKTLDEKEERDPFVKQGQAYMEIKDYNKAEDAFKKAIENKPRMARPYLDLATIYHQYKPDYISSIFYYKRYLELRPESEKKDFINEQIQKVQIDLRDAVLTQSGAFKRIQELEQQQLENENLKRQLAQYQQVAQSQTVRQPVKEVSQKSVTQTIPKSTTATSPTESNHQIYHVVAGDTLSKISAKFYSDSGQWDAIYQANKDRMKSPGDLRVGQTLVIPTLSN
jgi:tetratricopeptide (TPR) repeat protein